MGEPLDGSSGSAPGREHAPASPPAPTAGAPVPALDPARLVRRLALMCAGVAVVGLFPVPYGWFTLVRAMYCVALAVAVVLGLKRNVGWTLFLVPLALLYNPVVPVHLGHGARPLWVALNAAGCVLLWLAARSLARATTSARKAPGEPG